MATGVAGGPMAPAVADQGLVDGLVQLSFVVQSVLGHVVDAHDLSIIQSRLLGVLRDRELGMLELARFLDLEKSSVTGLVDRAERRGLVRRVAVIDDRRAVRVTLTAEGRALVGTVFDEVSARITELVAGLGAGDQKRLSRVAATVVADAAAAHGITL